jgi:hypothetical protein
MNYNFEKAFAPDFHCSLLIVMRDEAATKGALLVSLKRCPSFLIIKGSDVACIAVVRICTVTRSYPLVGCACQGGVGR